MWQSLSEHFTQPIAVFTLKGSVKGDAYLFEFYFLNFNIFFPIGIDLAKLVIKEIMLLEDADIQIVGLTSDGASTNKSMWKELGICSRIEGFKNLLIICIKFLYLLKYSI